MPPPETFARIFEPCAHCHQVGEGARATSGPQLTGIVGKPVASTDYPYSQAMRDSGLTWDEATLRDFLADPYGVVPGSRMRFEGLADEDIGPMIEFLKNPAPDTNG
ncbi:cytochrome c [Paracoccus alcaliphilus]|uniref:Cytochrome c n=1 Tax=Paracoccus alcaliphilus TaxID=34002 RepID=A0A1H8MX65_9RHOB|nr:c-type cytochrome [Paracoccus alcaliphilus]WCR19608.1 c-type cytochrome [Paracoccus alcaliphilus]SEO21836.1 cytochrome c [Paracoccus alcaliphilus]